MVHALKMKRDASTAERFIGFEDDMYDYDEDNNDTIGVRGVEDTDDEGKAHEDDEEGIYTFADKGRKGDNSESESDSNSDDDDETRNDQYARARLSD